MIEVINGCEYDVVTRDAELMADLATRFGVTLGSFELARYAVSIGLHPAGWSTGGPLPPIARIIGEHNESVFVWDTWDPDDEPGEEDGDETDDGPDPWAALDD